MLVRLRLSFLVFACALLASASAPAQEIATVPQLDARPQPLTEAELVSRCQAVPASKREHVHVYFINGFDPLYFGKLNALAEHCRALGFANVQCGQMTSTAAYTREIREVREQDPDSRVLVLGYSLGANRVRNMARSLHEEGIAIDVLVYLDCVAIYNKLRSRPDNCKTIINISGHGLVMTGHDLMFQGTDIHGAVNCRVKARHFHLPQQRETFELVGGALLTMAESVADPNPTPEETPARVAMPATTQPSPVNTLSHQETPEDKRVFSHTRPLAPLQPCRR
jgi:hypothetical protein